MSELDLLNFTLPKREFFVDFLPHKQEFIFYLIDNTYKKVIPYNYRYIRDLINKISIKGRQFNINKIGLYGKNGYMYTIYEELCLTNFDVIDRTDIYKFRMELDSSVRNRTDPIYCYSLLGYEFVSEDDYLKLLKNEGK